MMLSRSLRATTLPMALACLSGGAAIAQTAPTAPAPASPAPAQVNTDDFFNGFWRRPNMLGDMGGIRNVLGNVGVTLNLTDTDEVLGNLSGGLKQGFTYDGLTTLTLQMDTQKAFGLAGGTFNISGLQIRGRNLSEYYLANLQTASGIEASPTTRLWEIWYQQMFLEGRMDVKLGQQSIDQEFMVSQGSSLFVNTMMGWPMLPSADLYAGGPAYPLSSLGVRLRGEPTGQITVLGGVFQDNPPGAAFGSDSQLLGTTRWGGNFNLRTGALALIEVQYALNQPGPGEMVDASKQYGLPGTYKLGMWYDTAGFPSQQFDTIGLSLANPASNGNPKLVGPNYSVYGVADQMLWRPDPQSARSVNVFARLMGAPGDRNLIDFSLNTGVTLKSPLPGRDNDTFGVGYGLAHVGQGARGLDQASALTSGGPAPIRSSESFIEVTYQTQATPWLQIQPDFQYVFLPGAGVANPNVPGKRIDNEAIIGVRANVTF